MVKANVMCIAEIDFKVTTTFCDVTYKLFL